MIAKSSRILFAAPLGLLLGTVGCSNGSTSTTSGAGGHSSTASGSTGTGFTTVTGSGTGTGTTTGSGVPSTCIVGSKGCYCDSSGGCAPNLTCTPQPPPQPSLCCSGADCASAGGSIGKSCGAVSGAPSCTPGITIPPATSPNDNCGYPATSFIESTTICGINAVGGSGTKPAIIQVFYNDEHALTLGCATSTNPVSALSPDPGAVSYPQTGDPACVDTLGRPLRPVLFVTDISSDANCKAGDLQQGGTAYDPIAIFGSWKSATEDAAHVGTPVTVEPAKNNWGLTTSADPVPMSAMTACMNQGYGTELRYEVGLISGHSYRFQMIAHDGDQNKGGDSGEACAVFCAGTGMLCDPGVTVCAGGGTSCPQGTTCVQGCCLTIPQ